MHFHLMKRRMWKQREERRPPALELHQRICDTIAAHQTAQVSKPIRFRARERGRRSRVSGRRSLHPVPNKLHPLNRSPNLPIEQSLTIEELRQGRRRRKRTPALPCTPARADERRRMWRRERERRWRREGERERERHRWTAGLARAILITGKICERMSNLANMFAALDLDADGDEEEVEQPTSSKPAAAAAAARKIDGSMEKRKMIVNYDAENLTSSLSEYKMPLVWIDLEMTGLDISKDRILEIACIITDGKLTKRIEGPDLVIRQSKECLDNMNEWCKIHHGASGLTEQVQQSEISEHDAEKQVLDFIMRHIGSATPLIAGNSIYTDLLFLKEYMPQLAGIFPHVIVDVSSIMALCIRWFPKERKQTPRKQKNHRAMDDIRESIKELQYYKDNIFKSRQSKQ